MTTLTITDTLRDKIEESNQNSLKQYTEVRERIRATEVAVDRTYKQFERIEDKLDKLIKVNFAILGGVISALIGLLANLFVSLI